jgi:hypothetical protein
MKKSLEKDVLGELKKHRIQKKRYTFILREDAKIALASWCKENAVKESPALEQMIRSIIPSRFFSKVD